MTMTNPVRLEPDQQWTLDKGVAWRRVRMPWPTIARNLGQPLGPVRALYEFASGGAPIAPAAPVAARPAPVARTARKSPGRPPGPPVRGAEEMRDVCLGQACRLLAFTEDALERGARGSMRVRILAAAGFAHWSNQSKNHVAAAFGVRAHALAPSGLAKYQVRQAMIVALSARLWTLGFKP